MIALTAWFRLLCSGDVELNPGPLSEQELLTFSSLLNQSLTLAEVVMSCIPELLAEDILGDKGGTNFSDKEVMLL